MVDRLSNHKYNEVSKKKLIKTLETKFKTTMIGALARFEDTFGYLWGYGERGQLTAEQAEFKEMWDAVRTDILNNGNNQLRNTIDELSQYTISLAGYKVDFIVRRDNNG